MREADHSKLRSPRKEKIWESDQLIKKIKQLKDGFKSNKSNAKYSQQNRQKWQQYLPSENIKNIRSYFHSVSSREDVNHDHYRQSLQNRLQKLFRQEKELLKERHLDYNVSGSLASQNKKFSKIEGENQKDAMVSSSSISKMQRKIKILEEKYKILEKKDQNKLRNKMQTQIQKTAIKKQQENEVTKERERSWSEVPQFKRQNTGQKQWNERQKQLQSQVQQLKVAMREIKRNNEEILKKFEHKQQRKRHKQRTKGILLNILHKLEFINVQVANAKKFNDKQCLAKNGDKSSIHNTSKLQKETAELTHEFQLLKVEYKHLEEERKKVQMRQNELESKLKKIGEQQQYKRGVQT